MAVPVDDAIVQRLRAAGCVFAEDEARLLAAEARDAARLDVLVARRTAGEPIEYVVGWAGFCGLRIAVGPGVFVPRRRTELLAREAADRARPGAVVVDLCCGSGAIGVAVAAAVPGVEVHAADIDTVATRCAARNLAAAGGRVHTGDLYDALPRELQGRIAVLVANAPYVPTAEVELLPREARVHEPRATFDGGPDGLDLQRRVVAGARRWLAPGGHVLVEVAAGQVPTAVELFRAAGLHATVTTDDDLGAVALVGD